MSRDDSNPGAGGNAPAVGDGSRPGPDTEVGESGADDSGVLLVDRFEGLGSVGRRVAVLALVVVLFAVAVGVGRGVMALAEATVGVGETGTASRLLASVVGLQVLGFGIAGALVAIDRRDPLSYLRVDSLDQWVVFYGAAVGLVMMLLTVAMTLLFRVLAIDRPEAAIGVSPDPMFYVLLFLLSTFVAVPMEEVFFRGIVQARLEEQFHSAIAIGVTSLLFVVVHTSVSVGAGGELVALGLFFTISVVLGVSYTATENLFVPIIGHAIFNGTQIFVRTLEVIA